MVACVRLCVFFNNSFACASLGKQQNNAVNSSSDLRLLSSGSSSSSSKFLAAQSQFVVHCVCSCIVYGKLCLAREAIKTNSDYPNPRAEQQGANSCRVQRNLCTSNFCFSLSLSFLYKLIVHLYLTLSSSLYL